MRYSRLLFVVCAIVTFALQVEVFDPASGKFQVAAGQMDNNWHYIAETRLQDGRAPLAGGYPNSDQATAQTWIFRP